MGIKKIPGDLRSGVAVILAGLWTVAVAPKEIIVKLIVVHHGREGFAIIRCTIRERTGRCIKNNWVDNKRNHVGIYGPTTIGVVDGFSGIRYLCLAWHHSDITEYTCVANWHSGRGRPLIACKPLIRIAGTCAASLYGKESILRKHTPFWLCKIYECNKSSSDRFILNGEA